MPQGITTLVRTPFAWGTSLRSACPRLLEMTTGQLCGTGVGRTFKVEVALEDIADQFVAAADLRMTCIESKLIIVDETRYR
jgi:hypothetical protein